MRHGGAPGCHRARRRPYGDVTDEAHAERSRDVSVRMAQINACGRTNCASQLAYEFGMLSDAAGPQLQARRDEVGVHASLGAEVLAPHLPHGVLAPDTTSIDTSGAPRLRPALLAGSGEPRTS
jgi:hypothetical protein